MSKPKLFIIGLTGYIGSSVFHLIDRSKYEIAALIRKKDKEEIVAKYGVRVVRGDLDSVEEIEQGAYWADIVFNIADCDHMASAQAVVRGMEKKFKETGKKAWNYHTSGSGILVSWSETDGKIRDKIYSDDDREKLAAIPLDQPHRDVDTFLFDHADSYDLTIVTPPTIYGPAEHDTTLGNPRSVQLPTAIGQTLKVGQCPVISEGSNRWSGIHVRDLARFYKLLFEDYENGKGAPIGYLLPEAEEFAWGDVLEATAKEMHKQGLTKTSEVKHLYGDGELEEFFGPNFKMGKFMLGSNSRSRGPRCRALGWTPREGDIYSTIAEEVKAVVIAGRVGSGRYVL